MKLLAVETAFEPCSVALWHDGRVLERFESAPRSHAERLLPFVEEVLFSAEQVREGKPAPDLFLHAAASMGMDPDSVPLVLKTTAWWRS